MACVESTRSNEGGQQIALRVLDVMQVRAGVGQQLAEVAVGGTVLVAVLLIGHLLDGLATGLFHIADRNELNVLLLQETAEVIGSPVSNPDASDDNSLAGSDRTVQAQGRTGDDGRPNHRGGSGRRGEDRPE